MAVFSKDAVAAALDQLSQTLDEAKGGQFVEGGAFNEA